MLDLEFQPEELARKLARGANSNNYEDYLIFIKELEHQIADMTFTVPLYKYLKEVMKKEGPEDL